jgi:hypothetical protein
MASPDFREYIDLTVNDLQPIEVYNLARDYALVALPEFDPRVGTVEDAMLEAMSYVAGLVTGSVNRLPDGLMEGILRLMGFYRSEATFASGSVIFTSIDTNGLFIPAGTQVSFTETTADGVVTHIYATTSSVSIAEGESTSDPVQIAAVEAGEKPVVSDGTALTILTPINRLFDATFDGAFVQGTDSESDELFFDRAVTYLASLSRALANADQVTNFILSNYESAYRVKAYDLTRLQQFLVTTTVFDGGTSLVNASCAAVNVGASTYYRTFSSTGGSAVIENVLEASTPFGDTETTFTTVRISATSKPDYDGIWEITGGIQDQFTDGPYVAYDYDDGTETEQVDYPDQEAKIEFLDQIAFTTDDVGGCVTVFVSTTTGASLTPNEKAAIEQEIHTRCVAGISFYLSDVIVAPIDIDVDIAVLSGYSTLEVRTAVDDFLTAYVSPAEYPFTTLIRKNALISQVSQIDGVDYVETLTMTTLDATIATEEANGDIAFVFKGTLPSCNVTVTSV